MQGTGIPIHLFFKRVISKSIYISGDVGEALAASLQAARLFCPSQALNLTRFLSGSPDLRRSSTWRSTGTCDFSHATKGSNISASLALQSIGRGCPCEL